jgi:thiamine-monophosphate kinase
MTEQPLEPLSGEDDLIQRFFRWPELASEGVELGIGDDAAIVRHADRVAVATDTMVAGVHLPESAPARAWGHRALAVNLSDLAAMGATPRWCLLALTLPEREDAWLEDFSIGMRELASRYGCALIGGDLTRGPLSVTVTVAGTLPVGGGLRRGAAVVGDGVFVTGAPGTAVRGLERFRAGQVDHPDAMTYLYPEPRLTAGRDLEGLASSALDLSDGLTLDLARLLAGTGRGADLDGEALAHAGLELPGLASGDDYELLFTLPGPALADLQARASRWEHGFHRIGLVSEAPGLRVDGTPTEARGWDHFRAGDEAGA